jgi:hypothetical protein
MNGFDEIQWTLDECFTESQPHRPGQLRILTHSLTRRLLTHAIDIAF